MLPDDSLLVTLILFQDGRTFVDPHQSFGVLHMAKPMYSLKGMLPGDSILHGFLYDDKHETKKLGLFDATKIGGVEIGHEDALQRHSMLFDILHSSDALNNLPCHIIYHGAFYENACLKLDIDSLPFSTQSIMRLPSCNNDFVCERVMI